MLAKASPTVPGPDDKGGPFAYEPKWDGFRAIVSYDGEDLEIGSRGSKPLTRYFPEARRGAQGAAAGAVRGRR